MTLLRSHQSSRQASTFPAVCLRTFVRISFCLLCLAVSSQAEDRPAWLVVGPWDARIEGRVDGLESALSVVIAKLRITLNFDHPLPLSAAADSTAGQASASGEGTIPAIDFPPIVRSLRVEGGELVLKRGSETRTLSWQGEFAQTSPDSWGGKLTATGPGTELAANVSYRTMERIWRVSALAVRLDLSAWSALVLPMFLPKGMEWTCGGFATLEGALVWTPGGLDGTMVLAVQDGRTGSADGGIAIEGIEGALHLVSLAKLASAPAQRFTARAFTAGQVRMTNLVAETTLLAADRMTARIDGQGLGGRLAVDPFEFNPTEIRYSVNVRMDEIEAQPVLAMFPTVPQGTGMLVGHVPLSWTDGRLGFGEGRLALKPGTTGRVRFHNPGLFTQAWSAWLPGRKLLGQIEVGKEDLLVSELSIVLHAPGAPDGHAAVVRLVGVPAEHPRQGPYTFDFNINASLEGFINLGMKQNMSFDFK